MPDYRLYRLDGAGKFTSSHEFTAGSDEEALNLVSAMGLPVRCELWERSRMVGKLASLGAITDPKMNASSGCEKDVSVS
jgi:hypothetical protein